MHSKTTKGQQTNARHATRAVIGIIIIFNTPQNRLHVDCPICRHQFIIRDPATLPNARNIITLMDIKQTAVDEDQDDDKCPQHNEDLKIICVKCEEIICLECLTDNHKDHGFKKIIESYDEHKKQIDHKLVTAYERIRELETMNNQIQQVKDNLTCNGKIILIDINTRAAQLIDKIQETRKELTDRVNEEMDGKMKHLENIAEISSHDVIKLKNVIQEIEQCMNEWTRIKIVLKTKKLLSLVTNTDTNTKVVRCNRIERLSQLNVLFKSLPIKDERMKFGQVVAKPYRVNCNTACFIITVAVSVIVIIISLCFPQYFKK